MNKFQKRVLLGMFALVNFYLPAQQRYIFYLHGRIVEVQGANAVDSINGFGPYKYNDILDSLRGRHFVVISEVRPLNTRPDEYALKVISQIDSLIRLKVSPDRITLIGGSKGAVIAMEVSSRYQNKQISYVIMAGCTDGLYNNYPDIKLNGNVLSIFEKSDSFSTSCLKFRERSPNLAIYKEIELDTKLKHGFIYRPIKDWLNPAVNWALGNRRN